MIAMLIKSSMRAKPRAYRINKIVPPLLRIKRRNMLKSQQLMAGKFVVVANWKMHPATLREARRLFEATKKIAEKAPRASIIVAPSSIHLAPLAAGYKGKRVEFAAQNAHEGEVREGAIPFGRARGASGGGRDQRRNAPQSGGRARPRPPADFVRGRTRAKPKRRAFHLRARSN